MAPTEQREAVPPDERVVLRGLKDFQRRTVDYVFERLQEPEGPGRFLVADEVGLGKTLIARGLIARTITALWDTVDRIDIVYVCSNAEIASQNLQRLRVMSQDPVSAERLTLLPVRLRGLEHNKVNLVSMTPGTSLDPRWSTGVWRERVLLHRMLQKAWGLRGMSAAHLLAGRVDPFWFRDQVVPRRGAGPDSPLHHQPIDPRLQQAFADRLPEELREEFGELALRFRYARRYADLDAGLRVRRLRLVNALRRELARACLDALQPDLVILDEFQRFKHLLDGDDPAAELAQHLLNYRPAPGAPKVKVLLLSATPYKMCTLNCEADEDHYGDFIQTVGFLQDSPRQTADFTALLADYRRELFRLQPGAGHEHLAALKGSIESTLRQVMVRTERLASTADRSGMLREVSPPRLALQARDLHDYVALQTLARATGQPETIEYWKSAPYLLSLMEHYQFKQRVCDQLPRDDGLARVLRRHPRLLLRWRDFEAYRAIDPANARLRWLQEQTVGQGLWRLLWMPPCLPYYEPAGAYAPPAVREASKSLVFSCWHVVPKVIAALLSYEAERQAATAQGTPRGYRAAHSLLLQFARSEGRPTGLPILTLIYPCRFLAGLLDPVRLLEGTTAPPTLAEVLTQIGARLQDPLGEVVAAHGGAGGHDERWYWAAPVLLDLREHPARTRQWWEHPERERPWTDTQAHEADEEDEDSPWADHVAEVRQLLTYARPLGRPPEDLAQVLALMALAGPGVAALRALGRLARDPTPPVREVLAEEAARTAWCFRNLFNIREALAAVQAVHAEKTAQADDDPDSLPYWRRVLRYCAHGNLQAVLDEYCHVLPEQEGVADADPVQRLQAVGAAVRQALSIRTAALGLDEFRPRAPAAKPRRHRLRSRFAMRYGEAATEADETKATRPEQVRAAYNSPFRPFVLATTSVAQEGLDFHTYCHRVVHWNLPANPVDLEQREGRVHRYKGHAVRKNVAARHRGVVTGRERDPWTVLFAAAAAERRPGETELTPYWVYQVPDGAAIERHVPAVPFSRDQARMTALRRSLALYRMVFGQARQEDLLEYLVGRFASQELGALLEDLRIDLRPPQ